MKNLLKKSDVWAPPPSMLDIAERFVVAAYCQLVIKDTKPRLQEMQERVKEIYDINGYWLGVKDNIESRLDQAEVGNTEVWKSPPFNGVSYSLSVSKVTEDAYSVSISMAHVESIAGLSLKDLVARVVTEVDALEEYNLKGVYPDYLISLYSAIAMAEKEILYPIEFYGQYAEMTIPLDFSGWGALDSIARSSENFQNSVYEKMEAEVSKGLRFLDQAVGSGNYNQYDFSVDGLPQYNMSLEYDPSKDKFYLSRGRRKLEFGSVDKAKEVFRDQTLGFVSSFHMREGNDALIHYIEQMGVKSVIYVRFYSDENPQAMGLFHLKESIMDVFNPGSNLVTESRARNVYPDIFLEMSIAGLRDTVRHEMQHAAQSIASLLVSGDRYKPAAGYPSRAESPFPEYDGSGVRPGGALKEPRAPEMASGILIHTLRDIEFLTRLSDDIADFKRRKRIIPTSIMNRAISIWTGATTEPLVPVINNVIQMSPDEARVTLEEVENSGIPLPVLKKYLSDKISGAKVTSKDMDNLSVELGLLRKLSKFIRPSEFFADLKTYSGQNRQPAYVIKVFQDNIGLVPSLYKYVSDKLSGKPARMTDEIKKDIATLEEEDPSFDPEKFGEDLNSALAPSRWVRAVKMFVKEVL